MQPVAPKFSTPRLISRRQQIISALQRFRNKPLSRVHHKDVSDRIVDRLYLNREQVVLKDSAESEELQDMSEKQEMDELYESRHAAVDSILKPYLLQRLDDDVIKKIGIQVAGWWDELREGKEWEAWTGKTGVWSSIYVSEMHRMQVVGHIIFKATYHAFAGQIAGLTWEGVMTSKRAQIILHEISNRYERYYPEDLSGMWFTAYVHHWESQIGFKHICLSSSQEKDNRKTTKGRKKRCRGAFPKRRGMSCRPCPVSRATCKHARSHEGYTLERKCRAGHIGSFRPSRNDEYCHLCLTNGVYKRPLRKK